MSENPYQPPIAAPERRPLDRKPLTLRSLLLWDLPAFIVVVLFFVVRPLDPSYPPGVQIAALFIAAVVFVGGLSYLRRRIMFIAENHPMSRRNPNHVRAGTGEGAWTVYNATGPIGCVFGAATLEDARAAWAKAKGVKPDEFEVRSIVDPPPEGMEGRPSSDFTTPRK